MAGNLTAMIAAAFSGSAAPPVTSDPYYEYTTLLLPGNGTNGAQNNTFLDSSTNNFTITRNGNTTQGTFSPFSQTGWGNYFNGTNAYLSTSYNSAFDFGTGDFTIETWINLSAAQSDYGIISNYDGSPSNTKGYLIRLTSTAIRFLYRSGSSTDNFFDRTVSFSQSTWNHIAVVRSSGVMSIYVNGSLVGATQSVSAAIDATSTAGIVVGSVNNQATISQYFLGYISNLRIVKGRAVYTTAFTPPTSPLTRTTGGTNPPQGTETSLLTCQSNRFLDSNGVNIPASSPLTITVNGSPSVQAFSPFNPSASWSAATYGGSGYFDGSGDYLSAASNAAFGFGSGNFTIEFWTYVISTSNTPYWLDCRSTATANEAVPALYINAGNYEYFVSGSARIVGGAVPLNQWVHVALVRNGSTTTLYSNGTSTGTWSDSTTYATCPLIIGQRKDTVSQSLNGYIQDFRIVKGTAVYTSAFTPPTAPLTAITNTSLLLNYTNAGIYDATSKNDLETVGNAQISTTQSKWGGSSMYFDETGDYLTLPASQNVALGSGDFTIECWARFAASTVGNGMGLFQLSSGYLNSQVRGPAAGADNTTGRWSIYYGTSSTVHASLAPSTNTWYHVAFVRASGTSKLYVDGTEIISVSDSTNYTDTYFTVGGWYSSSFLLNGYLQDVRITKYARYTTNFTAPTAAFPTL